jgi:hypothetical protein
MVSLNRGIKITSAIRRSILRLEIKENAVLAAISNPAQAEAGPLVPVPADIV